MTYERTIAGPMELRHGRWQDVLADVPACAAVITDPPYTSRVMLGFRSGSKLRSLPPGDEVPNIPYPAITPEECAELTAWAAKTARHWVVVFNDHVGWGWLEEGLDAAGLYVFAPVVWHKKNAPPRFQDDGPADECEYICVARPREKIRSGRIRGHYETFSAHQSDEYEGLPGQKPLALMRALIRSYTKPGQLVVDPYAGTGTTLLAAAMEGRRAIGAEMDAGRYALASRRIRKGYTPDFFSAA